MLSKPPLSQNTILHSWYVSLQISVTFREEGFVYSMCQKQCHKNSNQMQLLHYIEMSNKSTKTDWFRIVVSTPFSAKVLAVYYSLLSAGLYMLQLHNPDVAIQVQP